MTRPGVQFLKGPSVGRVEDSTEEDRLGAGRLGNSLHSKGRREQSPFQQAMTRLKRGPVATSLTYSTSDVFKISTLKTWMKNKYLRSRRKLGKHNNHLT